MVSAEIINSLRGQNKPYEHIVPRMPQSTFSNTLRAIETGTAKVSTIKKFMRRFGYEYAGSIWVRVTSKDGACTISD